MKPEETVMRRADIENYIFGDKVWELLEGQLKAQAEISFKAGIKEARISDLRYLRQLSREGLSIFQAIDAMNSEPN